MKTKYLRLFSSTIIMVLILLTTSSLGLNAQCVNANAHTATSIPFLSSVTNPTFAYDLADGNTTTGTTLTVNGVGLAGLTVSFDQQANAGDSIIVMFGVPTVNIVDFGSLGGTTFTPYSGLNGTGTASSAVTAGSISFVISVGPNSLSRIAIPVTALAGAQSLQIQYLGIGIALNKTCFIYDVAVKPGPMVGSNSTICYNTATTLTASYNALSTQAIDVLWYDSDQTTLLQTTSNQNGQPYVSTYATPNLTTSKTYYVRERWNGCTTLSDPKAITVNVRPQITPTISVNCNTIITLSTTTTNGTGPFTYAWTASAGGNIVSGSNTASPTINTLGTYSVQIIDANGCIGATSRIILPADCATLPLPVELLYLRATLKEDNILLDWATASEQGNIGFDIERSNNSKDWKKIAFVPTQAHGGNSATKINYQFADENPLLGLSYYRLKQIDIDNKYQYSSIREIRRTGNIGISIRPNPASDYLIIEGLAGNELITIYDAINRVVTSQKAVQSSTTISLNNLPAGAYIVRIVNQEGQVYSKKIFHIK